MGSRDDFACDKAIAMARKGYLGFAIDIYGDAKVGKSKQGNATIMNNLLGEKYALMTRLRITYNTVKRIPKVDKANIAAIDFCFGGKCVLGYV